MSRRSLCGSGLLVSMMLGLGACATGGQLRAATSGSDAAPREPIRRVVFRQGQGLEAFCDSLADDRIVEVWFHQDRPDPGLRDGFECVLSESGLEAMGTWIFQGRQEIDGDSVAHTRAFCRSYEGVAAVRFEDEDALNARLWVARVPASWIWGNGRAFLILPVEFIDLFDVPEALPGTNLPLIRSED